MHKPLNIKQVLDIFYDVKINEENLYLIFKYFKIKKIRCLLSICFRNILSKQQIDKTILTIFKKLDNKTSHTIVT